MSHEPSNLTLGTRNCRESELFVLPRQNLYSILSLFSAVVSFDPKSLHSATFESAKIVLYMECEAESTQLFGVKGSVCLSSQQPHASPPPRQKSSYCCDIFVMEVPSKERTGIMTQIQLAKSFKGTRMWPCLSQLLLSRLVVILRTLLLRSSPLPL